MLLIPEDISPEKNSGVKDGRLEKGQIENMMIKQGHKAVRYRWTLDNVKLTNNIGKRK